MTVRKSNLINVELESYQLPLFKERKYGGREWIDYGTDNLFPLYLVDLFNQSAVHNAIITGKCKYIAGRGLTLAGGANEAAKNFVMRPNSYETLEELFRKICLDYEIFNGFALKIVRAKRGNKVVEVHHMDWTTLRRDAEDKNKLWYSDEWEAVNSTASERKKNSNPTRRDYPKFDPNGNAKVSILYYMEYRPDVRFYPYPEYVGAIPQIETTTEIAKFDLNSIKNGFSGGTIINMLNGLPESDEEAEEIEQDITEKLTGSENANRVLVNFAEDREHSSHIEQVNGNDLAERYKTLEERVMQHVFIGHKVVSPMLFGVRSEGQLGGRREILEAYELFKETYALHRQNNLIGALNDLCEIFGGTRSIMIEELKPINPRLPISDEDVVRLVGDDSLRKYVQNTYGVDVVEATPVKENVVMSEVQLGDDEAVLSYLSTVGVNAEDYDIVTGREVNTGADLVELEHFALMGEEELEARFLQAVDSNDGESATAIGKSLGYSFEDVLGRLLNLIQAGYLVRQGAKLFMTKKAKNKVDLLPERLTDLKIMYQYEVRPDVVAPKNGSRPFCSHLMASGKLFTREEIDGMRNHMKVSFMDDINDVWSYRGGWYTRPGSDVAVPMCRHRWKQVVVRKKK